MITIKREPFIFKREFFYIFLLFGEIGNLESWKKKVEKMNEKKKKYNWKKMNKTLIGLAVMNSNEIIRKSLDLLQTPKRGRRWILYVRANGATISQHIRG